MKLEIEIVTEKKEDPWCVLSKLAVAKLRATQIHELDGSGMIGIDDGINDIRAQIVKKNILFYFRYEKDQDKYESLILDFCREHGLTLRFAKGNSKVAPLFKTPKK